MSLEQLIDALIMQRKKVGNTLDVHIMEQRDGYIDYSPISGVIDDDGDVLIVMDTTVL